MNGLSLLTAFIAGLLSFISPCILPLMPAYISFISGVSIESLRERGEKRIITNTILFIFGFSLVFILLGASATMLGQFLLSKIALFRKIAGVVVIVLGLHLMGLFKIKMLYREKRFHSFPRSINALSPFLMGLAFAFGWTPCIGPILAAILAYAGTKQTINQGLLLLTAYSLGLSIPFFLTGLSINAFLRAFNKIKEYFRMIEIVSGTLLIIIGLLIFTNNLQMLCFLR